MKALIAACLLVIFGSQMQADKVAKARTAWNKAAAQTAGLVDDKAGKEAKAPDSRQKRRLESATWNPVTHHLIWKITAGTESSDGKYAVKGSELVYEIDMDNATMTFQGETRRFSSEEAARVRRFLDALSSYAVESVIWWEDGQGEPLQPKRVTKVGDDPGSIEKVAGAK